MINIVKKIYIITGANGFLGNNIIRKLEQDADNEIRAFVLKGGSIKSLEGLKCKIYYGDVTKKETLSLIFENTDGKEVFVIHCAAVVYIKSKYNPLVYNVNVNGTKNIVDKVIESKAKLIYISSVHAIPELPHNELITEITNFNTDNVKLLYAKTKAEAAKYVIDAVKGKNLNACIIHPSGIIGPNDFSNSHLTQLIKEVANGKLFACVKGAYDFVDVILTSVSRKVTNLITYFDFIQTDKVTDTMKARSIVAYFTTEDGEKISFDVPIVANSREDAPEKRTFHEKFTLKTREYKYGDKYYLVLADANDEKNILQRYEFMIDIAFVDDFGF